VTLSTALKFRPKFFWKWSFFDQKQQLLKNVEPFERILRALLIAQRPFKFSSFLDLRNGSSRFRLFARDFRLFRFFFSRSACFSKVGPPPNFAKLSKMLWKIWKFWKRISVDQIQCGGEGKGLQCFAFWFLSLGSTTQPNDRSPFIGGGNRPHVAVPKDLLTTTALYHSNLISTSCDDRLIPLGYRSTYRIRVV